MKLYNVMLTTLLATPALIAHDIEISDETNKQVQSVREAIGNIGETEDKNVSAANALANMFKNGKVSGQIRATYAGYDYKNDTDTYATALGGQLKYELADYNGFNAAAAFYTSNDIGFATGEGTKHNNELSSSAGHYTDVTEAYINYKKDGLNFRAGRQMIDTPLADSDDIRMIPNTFDAYIATYTTDNLTLLAGNLQKWQGYDATLDNGWQKTGEYGTWMASAAYSTDKIDASLWYYSITRRLSAYYGETSFSYPYNDDIKFTGALQVLIEREQSHSNEEADIYGASAEFNFYGIGVNFAYNKAIVGSGKQTFSGFGGGTLFTSMDTMILDNIAVDRDAQSFVTGISYTYNNLNLLYAYGDFEGNKNSSDQKAHIIEHNLGCEYDFNDNFRLSAVYAIEDNVIDTSDTSTNFDRLQIMAIYNF